MSRRITLGAGAEFDLIRRLLGAGAPLPPEVTVGPGDDAAVLEGGWVLTTDISVEDVHFRRAWLSDRDIGYRAGAAALSDIAAMAASPVGVLVTLAVPARGGVDVESVSAGVREMAESVGAAVIGGDLSRSPGPLVIDVVALGRAAEPVTRDGAARGDEVWVTGPLGGSAAAVRLWLAGQEPPAELREAFARPRPRIEEARSLQEHGVLHALIDISDGVAGDAGHIAAASGVRVTLEASAIPLAAGAVSAFGGEEALALALHGGEDYELCFTTAPGAVDSRYFAREHRIELTRVGRVSEGEGVWLEESGRPARRLSRGGYDHWGREPA